MTYDYDTPAKHVNCSKHTLTVSKKKSIPPPSTSDCRNGSDDDAEKTALGIFFTNCMNFVEESAAVFPLMARTNHSCAPNTEFITNTALSQQELVAVKPIKEGQELTLRYKIELDSYVQKSCKLILFLTRQEVLIFQTLPPFTKISRLLPFLL